MTRSKPTRTTIDDVARRARVAISTVSRVLNGRDRVHPETRARVLAAIEELNYRPSALARSLATQRTHMLGFLIPSLSDPFYHEIVRGVEETTMSAGYNLLIASQPKGKTARQHLELFTQQRVDGLIMSQINIARQEVESVMRQGLPVALVLQDLGADIPTVLVDDYQGACQLVEHLLAHGHRRIAYIAGNDDGPSNQTRLRALRDTLMVHGLTLPSIYIGQGNYFQGSGYDPMVQLLALEERPDAVFAANDVMAGDALAALHDHGVRVPEDMAIVGFDDIPLASYLSPPLTTVRQPTYEVGYTAAQLVLTAIDGATTSSRKMLTAELVIRRSCGCTA
ncbi:MAG: LacI family DNA-binding transcriptional regulator [Caldilineaceae bacterium]